MKTKKPLTKDNYTLNDDIFYGLNIHGSTYLFRNAIYETRWAHHRPKKQWLHSHYWLYNSYKLSEFIYHYVLPEEYQKITYPLVIPTKSLRLKVRPKDSLLNSVNFTNLTKHWALIVRNTDKEINKEWHVLDFTAHECTKIPHPYNSVKCSYVNLKWPYEKGYIGKFYTKEPSKKTQAIVNTAVEHLAVTRIEAHDCTIHYEDAKIRKKIKNK